MNTQLNPGRLIRRSCLAMMSVGLLHTAALAGNVSVQVLDKEGKPMADAVVVVTPANKSVVAKVQLPMLATIAQEKMQFIPAITVVPVGAKLRFINNDPWDHHVRAGAAGLAQFSQSGTPSTNNFELRLEGRAEGKPAKGVEVVLDKAGAFSAMLMGCFIHGSMRGHIYVSDSAWTTKTGADGLASWDDVPEGAASIRVWHADQLIDLPVQQVYVANVPIKASAQLSVVPRRRRI